MKIQHRGETYTIDGVLINYNEFEIVSIYQDNILNIQLSKVNLVDVLKHLTCWDTISALALRAYEIECDKFKDDME